MQKIYNSKSKFLVLLYWTYNGYQQDWKSWILCKSSWTFSIKRVQSLLYTPVIKQNGIVCSAFARVLLIVEKWWKTAVLSILGFRENVSWWMRALLPVFCKHRPFHFILYARILTTVSLSSCSQSQSSFFRYSWSWPFQICFQFPVSASPVSPCFLPASIPSIYFSLFPRASSSWFAAWVQSSLLLFPVSSHFFCAFTRHWSQFLLLFIDHKVAFVLLHWNNTVFSS